MSCSRKSSKCAARMTINISLILNGKSDRSPSFLSSSDRRCVSFRYVSILVELTRLEGTKHGSLISLQLLDVAIRVESIRQFACNQMVRTCRSLSGQLHRFVLGCASGQRARVHSRLEFVECGRGSLRCRVDLRRVQLVSLPVSSKA